MKQNNKSGERTDLIRRREFFVLVGGASVLARETAAEPASRVIGYLSPLSQQYDASGAFVDGLRQTGFVAGSNLRIEYCWADGHYERLGPLAADLVARGVALIAALGSPDAALAAHDASATIPIVFAVGDDPVAMGLVKSINRPGTNATGVSYRNNAMVGKRIEMLHQLIPAATVVAFLTNPARATSESEAAGAATAADHLGLRLVRVRASNESDLAAAFASAKQHKVGAVAVASDAVLNTTLAAAISALALRTAMPILANSQRVAAAGGLASYGPDVTAGFRKAGVFAGRILNGANPADLPVEQPDTFKFVINLKTAKALNVAIPPTVLALADEVIE